MATPTTDQVLTDNMVDTFLTGIRILAWEAAKFCWGWPGVAVLAFIILLVATRALRRRRHR